MRQYDVAELYNTVLRDFGVAASSEAAYTETCFEVLREADNPFRRLSVGPNNHYGPTEPGDSVWSKALYAQWKATAPVWPVGPDEMRYYEPDDRDRALDWVRHGGR